MHTKLLSLLGRRFSRLLVIFCGLGAIAGCQERLATVSGVVKLDGKPVAMSENARGTIVFQSIERKGMSANGLLDAAGRFQLTTGTSRNIAPGKYQVAVSIVEMLPKSDEMESGATRVSPAKYASGGSSGFEVDVLPTANVFEFDMKSNSDVGAEAVAAPSEGQGTTAIEGGTSNAPK
jgi:hypothetical protein